LERPVAEEGFIQLYVRDFTNLASKAEGGQEVEAQVQRRVREARQHAVIMDARKESGHLEAVCERLKLESRRGAERSRFGDDPEAVARREAFLLRVADMLRQADPAIA
jgi:hypothetical protein